MSKAKVQRLNSGSVNVSNLIYGVSSNGKKTPSLNGNLLILTKTTTNIYSNKNDAINKKGNTPDDNAMLTVKSDTLIKVTNRANIGTDIILQVDCGGKKGYIYAGQVYNSNVNSSSPTFKWKGSPYVNFAIYTTTPLSHLNLKGRNLIDKKGYEYENLNNGNTSLNTNRIVSGTEIDISDAEDNVVSSTSSNINSMIDNANNTATGEVSTNEYAVKANQVYAYNIKDHLGGVQNVENFTQSTNGINYTKLRNIFGIPYQFLPTTDCRVSSGLSDDIEIAGYEFAEKIASRIPLLYITPGNTSFMGNSKKSDRKTLIGKILEMASEKGASVDDNQESGLSEMFDEYSGKLYTVTPAYKEYFSYVNPLCRVGAMLLDIGGTSYNSTEIESTVNLDISKNNFSNMNWGISEGLAYETFEEQESTSGEEVEDENSEVASNNNNTQNQETNQDATEPEEKKYEEDYSDFFKDDESSIYQTIEKSLYYSNAIAFYINSDTSFTDSFGNETTDSTLASMVNGLSDKAREIQFLLGTAKDAVGEAYDRVAQTVGPIKEQIDNIVNKIAGGNSIFTTIANSVKTIVSGGRLLFPQIWSNSSFSRSYNISIKLTTPSTDRVSWWLNIYVPLCHLMALVCPRAEYVNSYTTPFIIKAFYKGMFNIDMGIITEMTFNKGKEGSWTKDALPTVVDVSFTIQDLYSSMGISSTQHMFKGHTLQNVAEMDYVANLCGININEPDSLKMANFWCAFNITNKMHDFAPNLSLGIQEYVSTSIINAYNNFWF